MSCQSQCPIEYKISLTMVGESGVVGDLPNCTTFVVMAHVKAYTMNIQKSERWHMNTCVV